ncbi:MAG: hypothetical protein K0U44_03240 [Actinomycetia bacterium]|nr:hypothetical protein [Actinomycetes bacterium]
MRLVTGAALATALLLTGCGTQVDPFQDDEADAQAEALEVAWQACEVWQAWPDDPPEPGSEDYYRQIRRDAEFAGLLASQAAYLDPRWRTLADAFPYLVPFHELSAADAAFAEDGDTLREELRDQAALWGVYTNVTYQECEAVYVLRGDRESFYDKFFADPQGDPDTE